MGEKVDTPQRTPLTAHILKAMSLFTGVQAVGIICSVVRTKLIALWIGAAGVGLFAIFNSMVELMSSVTQLNMRQSSVRDLAAAGSKAEMIASSVRWWALLLGVAGALLTALLSPLLSYFSFGVTDWWWGFALLSLAIFAISITNGEQAIMQGVGQLKVLATCTIWGMVGGTLLSIPLYYFWGEDCIVPSIMIFAIVSMIASYALKVVPRLHIGMRPSLSMGIGFIKLGVYLTIPSGITYAAAYAFVSYLNNIGGPETTGFYQAGYTLVIRYTGIIFTALAMEYFPRISKVAHLRLHTSVLVSHEILIVLYLLCPALVIFVCADELMIHLFYSSAFIAAVPFVRIGILAMVFRAISYCLAYVILAKGDGRTYIVTETLSTALGLSLNILMYNYFSFIGLGISYVIWYMAYLVIVYMPYRRYGMRLSKPALIVSALVTAIVAAAILLRPIGWWASLTMLIPASALSLYGYKMLR